jgi:hypothetical protein
MISKNFISETSTKKAVQEFHLGDLTSIWATNKQIHHEQDEHCRESFSRLDLHGCQAEVEFFLVPSQEAVAASDDVTSKSPTGSFTVRILISVKVRTLSAASPSAMNELL